MPYPIIPDVPQAPYVQADPTTTTQKENIKASNTPPTVTDDASVAVISPNNTGLPVNIPTILQKANAKSTGSVASLAAVFANNNVAGNSVIVVAGCGNGTAMTVADSNSNTYTQAVNAANSTTFEAAIFYAVNVAGGANTVTVTNAGSTASMAVEIYEVSGIVQQVLAALGQSSSGTGTGTTATTSTIAGPPNSLAFMGVSIGTAVQNITVTTSTNWTADAGTNGLVPTTPAGLYQFQSLSQYLHGLRPVLPTATLAGSEPWAAAAAVFKPVVLGVEGTFTVGGYNYTNITAAAPTTTVVKTGAGTLHAIVANTPPGSNGTVTIYDNTAGSGTKIGTITYGTVTSMPPHTVPYDLTFSTGLTIVTATGAGDYTIVWR